MLFGLLRVGYRHLMQDAPGIERMISRNMMTIQIPGDLARGLEGIAAAQQKSHFQGASERRLLSLPFS
jgi:hypothetical protein